uniref:snRNA-activating protein complex subunit 3 n=1 Tax=Meloidogyne incognita TaxID=6306 RepID=A0A914LYR0_MELIC
MSLDNLFKSDEKHFISPIIDLQKFLAEATFRSDRLRNFFGSSESHDSRDIFRQFLAARGLNNEESNSVIETADGFLTQILDDSPMDEYEITFPPKDSQLMTHKVLHDIRRTNKTSATKNAIVRNGKYFKYREQELRRYYTPPNSTCNKDIVLTVQLLKPYNRTPEIQDSLKNRTEVKFLVRGDMPLVKLREKIFCASDFWSNYEDFEIVPPDPECYFDHKFPSSFIFVHDTFYVDKRRANSIDISEPIREFMKRKKKDFGEFHVKDMAGVKIIDFKLRLGQPYVYVHQGFCEHLIIFTDLRLLLPGDIQRIEDYPIRLFDIKTQKLCCACSDEISSFVVTESDRLPNSPAFFCSTCFSAFHYDNGQRIGNFKAYHYLNHAGTE